MDGCPAMTARPDDDGVIGWPMTAARRVGLLVLRRVGLLVLALVALLAPPGTARADAAAPTDFRSEIVAITPPTDAITVSILGGDAFVMLRVRPGSTVEIAGYRAEPYLMFDADGTVRVNDASPTAAANTERYGAVPAAVEGVDPLSVPPIWRVVATDGTYAWHDHRTHWMAAGPPADTVRGAVFATSWLDLVVDGQPVRVDVAFRWLGAPSEVPTVGGLLLGVFAVLIVLSARKPLAIALGLAALAAAGVGWWQYRSFPPAADPPITWYLLPALAVGAALVALVLRRSLMGRAALLLGGLLLGGWVVLRRDGFTMAALPTDAPFWLDRGVSAAAGVVAAIAAIGGGLAMFRLPTPEPEPEPPPPAKRSRSKQSATTTQTTTWGRKR